MRRKKIIEITNRLLERCEYCLNEGDFSNYSIIIDETADLIEYVFRKEERDRFDNKIRVGAYSLDNTLESIKSNNIEDINKCKRELLRVRFKINNYWTNTKAYNLFKDLFKIILNLVKR